MNVNKEVDAWFDDFDHPLKDAMVRVREVILGADSRIEETVKWSTPTFMYKPESTEGGRRVSILKWPEGALLNLG